MLQRVVALIALTLITVALFILPATADESLPVLDTTISLTESGAVHFKIIPALPANRDGVTTYHFELQKMYNPENVSVYDSATGKPLSVNIKDMEGVTSYDVSFDRPYYNGYSFVIEYDNHKRLIDEGSGVYSIGMRPAVSIVKTERIFTIILPPENFTYLGYNQALDHPVSVTNEGRSTIIVFRNTSSAPADYAWEIKFRAIGVRDEVRKVETGGMTLPVPGMTFVAALAALWAIVLLRKE